MCRTVRQVDRHAPAVQTRLLRRTHRIPGERCRGGQNRLAIQFHRRFVAGRGEDLVADSDQASAVTRAARLALPDDVDETKALPEDAEQRTADDHTPENPPVHPIRLRDDADNTVTPGFDRRRGSSGLRAPGRAIPRWRTSPQRVAARERARAGSRRRESRRIGE